MRPCSFCSQINDEHDHCNYFYNNITCNYGLENRVITETDNWIVVPTIGAFVQGYVLAISKKHYNSIASTPSESYAELAMLKEQMNRIFQEKYGKPCYFFEHGAISDEILGTCCVSHTHLHMLPLDIDINNYLIKKYGFNPHRYKSFSDTSNYININNIKSYYLYGCGNSEINIQDVSNALYPSQFFRQIICNRLGELYNYDWRKDFFVDNMVATIDDLKGYFSTFQKSAPYDLHYNIITA